MGEFQTGLCYRQRIRGIVANFGILAESPFHQIDQPIVIVIVTVGPVSSIQVRAEMFLTPDFMKAEGFETRFIAAQKFNSNCL